MAKQRLVLAASPTFKLAVGIPVPGNKDGVPVEFTFRHRTKSDLKTWREAIDLDADGITAEHVMQMASGWDLEDAWTAENIATMLEQFPGSGVAIFVRYMQELQDAKLGNFGR
jgi:hypothetical protein